ncbi:MULTISPECIES: hypothetical protein [unclassified Bacillus (in: firmicutes)]
MFRFVPSIDLPKVINKFNEPSKTVGENNG